MKVKNIAFSGFAAAMLLSAGVADAATTPRIASEQYVINKLGTKADTSTVDTLGGRVKTIEDNKISEITDANKSSSDAYPTIGAVTTYTAAQLDATVQELTKDGLPVNTSKIADRSITGEKLADKTVGTDKLADKAVTDEKLSEDLQGQITQIGTNKTNIINLTADVEKKADKIENVGDKAGNFATVGSDGQYSVSESSASSFATPGSVTDAINAAVTDEEGAVKKELDKKQNALTTAQQTAVNSGITAELVTKIGTNETNIDKKADKIENTTTEDMGKITVVGTDGQYVMSTYKPGDFATPGSVTDAINAAVTDADSEVKKALDTKANANSVYTKTETYSQDELNTKFDAKIPYPGVNCTSESGRCVLTAGEGVDGRAELQWIEITQPLDDSEPVPAE